MKEEYYILICEERDLKFYDRSNLHAKETRKETKIRSEEERS